MFNDSIEVAITEDAVINVTIVETETIAVAITTIEGVVLAFANEVLDTDGEETSFTFEQTFLSGSLMVFKNGIFAKAGTEYTEKIDKSGIDFSEAPASDDEWEVRYAYV